MTASLAREVQSNRLFGAAPESALACPQTTDGQRQNGRDLGEAVGVAGWE
jgi:hypothetical protein